jgi:hypothetical protein
VARISPLRRYSQKGNDPYDMVEIKFIQDFLPAICGIHEHFVAVKKI